MKKCLRARLKRGLFPKTPETFVDRLYAVLPKEPLREELPETAPVREEKPGPRVWPTLLIASLGTILAALIVTVVVGALKPARRQPGAAENDRVPEASETAAPVIEAREPSVVGKWKLWKIDYHGVIVSASASGAGMLYSAEFLDDGTANMQEGLVTQKTYAYTFDGGTVTLSAEGEDDVVLTYDAEADTLTMQQADDGAKMILRREIPEEPAKPSAVGVWSNAAGVDFAQQLTVRDDGTATLWQTAGALGEYEIQFSYTEQDGELLFFSAYTGRNDSFTARYDEETDVLSVTRGGSTEEWTRATPEFAGSKWTLSGIEFNGTVMDADYAGLQIYLAFSDDGTVTMTMFLGSEGDSAQFRYLVTGNRIELKAIDAEDSNSALIDGLVYDPQTDTLRLEYDTTTMAYDMAMLFSRTPDAVIPEIPEIRPDLVGKWTVTEVRMDGQTVDPSMLGGEFSMWLELRPDGSATLTGLSDVDGIEQDGQYTVTGNTVVITDENGEPLTLTYDPATDTLFAEHTYSDYNLTLGLRFARTPDAEIPELPSEELAELKKDYPEYFGLDTSKGLKVYVWQMSNESYSCALVSGKEEKTDAEISKLRSVSIERMLLILSTYDVPAEQIEIVPFRNPLSSYWYEIDEAYTQRLVWLLNGTPDPTPYLTEIPETGETVYEIDDPEHILNVLTDVEVFDVDGDGRLESCRLSFGPTSGLFTVVFHVYRNGKLVYLNTFNMEFGTLSFVRKNGALLLKRIPQNATEERYYAVSIENGAIVLTDESTAETVPYWGAEDPEWNIAVAKLKTPEEMLEGLWCAVSGDPDQVLLLEIRFYTDAATKERKAEIIKDGFSCDGYSYTVEEGDRNESKTDNPWYRFTFTKGDEALMIDVCMDMDNKEPDYMDWNVDKSDGGIYLKCPVIEASALPYQQREYYGAGEGFVGYLDVVDLNGDENPVRVKVASYDPNRYIDKGEEPELTVQIGRGEWTVNEELVWDSLIYADLDPNDGHGNVLVSAKRADGTVVTYELHPEGDKVVCGHVGEGYCETVIGTDNEKHIVLRQTAPLGSVDGLREIKSGESLEPETDWWTVPRITYSSYRDRDWLVQHGELLHLIRDLPCEIDGKSAVLEAGTYLYLSRYHESLDRIEFLTEDNRTVLVCPDAGLLLDGVPLADYFEQPTED